MKNKSLVSEHSQTFQSRMLRFLVWLAVAICSVTIVGLVAYIMFKGIPHLSPTIVRVLIKAGNKETFSLV